MKQTFASGVCVLLLALACSSPQNQQEAKEAGQSDSTQMEAKKDADGRTSMDSNAVTKPQSSGKAYKPVYPETAPAQAEEAFTDFARNAFPPTMPEDTSHKDAWLKQDCLRCHETGENDAPRVAHRGMSPQLLEARCRTCHLPGNQTLAAAEGSDLGEVLFARNAFPPTLPNDRDHNGGWLRSDCMKCHENGVAGAPKVQHKGMAPILLEARCRTCHVTSAPSGETDYPEKRR